MVAIKRKSRLTIKVLKSFGPTEVACAAVRKHADRNHLFCRSDNYVLCYPDQNSLKFISGSNEQFTVELYKEELDQSFSKIDFFLCKLSNDALIARSLKTRKLA